MNIFYQPDILESLSLSQDESTHAVKVLRMHAGDAINIIDGSGTLYNAKIVDAHPHKCSVEIVSSVSDFGSHPYYLHIAVAPTKNIDRFEWFVEKAVEIGVDRITPILCRHSERTKVNIDRLNKIVVSAAKQSLKAKLPTVDPLTDIKQLIEQTSIENRFIAHCAEGQRVELFQAARNAKEALILIGPEGDFAPEEIDTALHANFQPITLGDSRLRTETAAIVAVHTVQLISVIS